MSKTMTHSINIVYVASINDFDPDASVEARNQSDRNLV